MYLLCDEHPIILMYTVVETLVQFSPLIFSAEDFCLSALYIVDRLLYVYTVYLSFSLSVSLFFLLFNFKVSFDRKLLSITLFH